MVSMNVVIEIKLYISFFFQTIPNTKLIIDHFIELSKVVLENLQSLPFLQLHCSTCGA